MSNKKHLTLLKHGAVAWNAWRTKRPKLVPDLVGADLHGADLRGANLCGADLSKANLRAADLSSPAGSGSAATQGKTDVTSLLRAGTDSTLWFL
jgi:hypothetical protein